MDWFGLEDKSESEKIKSVSEVSGLIKNLLDNDSLHRLWVEGEVTNFKKNASGHFYFSLGESVFGREYLINCAMWRSAACEVDFSPENGLKVQAYGSVDVYEPHGKYQFIVRELRVAGEGDKHLLVARWKRELAEEGFFNEMLKKPLPRFPQRVGVVTSPTGAARRDIENIISRRYPVEIVLSPASVQGDNAPAEIAAALERIDGLVDVIIVGRGGGSFEDLFPFNHPDVVRAVFRCRTPVVSAVGHEIDYTLTDLAADLRAPTPSAAAEIVVPDKKELMSQLRNYDSQLGNSLLNRIEKERELLEYYRMHIHPSKIEQIVNEQHQGIDDLFSRLDCSIRNYIEREKMSLDILRTSMKASDPQKPLKDGYCIVRKEDSVVLSAGELSRGDIIEILMAGGECTAKIEGVNYGEDVRRAD